MPKQKAEGIFRDSLKLLNEKYWYLKLQVNPLSHTVSPADFLVITNKRNYLIEVKEVKLNDSKGSFVFDRLKQKDALETFESFFPHNKSFVFIFFREKKIPKSKAFLIPIKEYVRMENEIGKKSGNVSDFIQLMELYICQYNTGGTFGIAFRESPSDTSNAQILIPTTSSEIPLNK